METYSLRNANTGATTLRNCGPGLLQCDFKILIFFRFNAHFFSRKMTIVHHNVVKKGESFDCSNADR